MSISCKVNIWNNPFIYLYNEVLLIFGNYEERKFSSSSSTNTYGVCVKPKYTDQFTLSVSFTGFGSKFNFVCVCVYYIPLKDFYNDENNLFIPGFNENFSLLTITQRLKEVARRRYPDKRKRTSVWREREDNTWSVTQQKITFSRRIDFFKGSETITVWTILMTSVIYI